MPWIIEAPDHIPDILKPTADALLKAFSEGIHAGALAYVDLFVTRDGLGKDPGLIQKVEWYDRNVRIPRGAAPYDAKLCRGWRDFLQRAVS